MARTDGSRNQNYGERRRALLLAVRDRLATPGASRSSLRDLAKACGVSIATLRHYFPSREELIVAVMAENLADGRPHLDHVATPTGAFAGSIRELLGYVAFGFSHGVGEIHTVGLTEGLRDVTIGPGYVDHVLEPSIDAVRRRLDRHVEAGDMLATDTRHAAIVLLSPVVLLMLHQRELGGAGSHPVDVDVFLDHQAEAFARGYGAPDPRPIGA